MIFWIFAPLAVILVGIAKAGFGGGVGIVAVPIFILATGDAATSLGTMLPILCACDLFAIAHYRNTFDKWNIISLVPGVIIGVALCGYFLGEINKIERANEYLKILIGSVSLIFVLYHIGYAWIMKKLLSYKPKRWHGWLFGTAVGITSTMAHAGGPPATMYLLPQKMGRRLYVGTTVILFTIVNAVKLVPYFYHGMINVERMKISLILLPFVPLGTFLGVWMNKKFNETAFNSVIYVILFILGIKLITGFDPISFLIDLKPLIK